MRLVPEETPWPQCSIRNEEENQERETETGRQGCSLWSLTSRHPRGMPTLLSLCHPYPSIAPLSQHGHPHHFSLGHWWLLVNVYPVLLLSALHGNSPHKHPSQCWPQETPPATVPPHLCTPVSFQLCPPSSLIAAFHPHTILEIPSRARTMPFFFNLHVPVATKTFNLRQAQ